MSHTVKQIAERYQVKLDTALSWIHCGDLKAINIGRKGAKRPCWRITPEALASFEQLRASGQKPDDAPVMQVRKKKSENIVRYW